MTNGTEQLTCGTCRHWHKLPPDPRDLKKRMGHCRHSPPTCTSTLVDPQRGLSFEQSAYPTLPHEFPACGQHSPQPIALERA